ncbi:sugar transferase [Frigidibacter sp. MR17.14]|uniref:sugar transferase n=1 Tax=Frigidibacter sp. MR17.14 TaxID=3126509 RepID=UPI00301310AA
MFDFTAPAATRSPSLTEVRPRGLTRGIWRRGGKRLFDLALVLMMAPIALPLILVFAALVKIDGGKAFYTQERVGRNGRIFRMIKLRSMVPDAEARLAQHLETDPEARAEWARSQKLTCDPRITRVGWILRRTSLDELPQLWNVLTGEMSLVGPRPMMVSQIRLYPGKAYYRLRPGITGSWQVSERHTSAFADRAAYDGDYEQRLSLGTDLGILWRTIAVVLRCSGC